MLFALLLASAAAAQDVMTVTAKASTAVAPTTTGVVPVTTARPDPGWVTTNGPAAGDIAAIVLGVVCGLQFFGLVSPPAD
jgi:hypothetical protein